MDDALILMFLVSVLIFARLVLDISPGLGECGFFIEWSTLEFLVPLDKGEPPTIAATLSTFKIQKYT